MNYYDHASSIKHKLGPWADPIGLKPYEIERDAAERRAGVDQKKVHGGVWQRVSEMIISLSKRLLLGLKAVLRFRSEKLRQETGKTGA